MHDIFPFTPAKQVLLNWVEQKANKSRRTEGLAFTQDLSLF